MAMENAEFTKLTSVGFENKEDLLDEINYRYKLINKCNILLKKIPTQLTRIAMKDLIPEMTTCRFPEKISKKANYAFIQFANDELVDKYIQLLNKKQLYGKQMIASKLKPATTFTDVNIFDLKKLYFNGLKSETKYYQIKEIVPNAKVNLPVHDDKSCRGYFTLTFESEEEAMQVFMENKLTLHGVKCHLIFLIKSPQMKEVEESKKQFTLATPKALLNEIMSRFEARNNCTVMVKNLPADFNLSKLKELVLYMRNCKICMRRKRGFLDFDNSELALQAVKELNGKVIGNKTARAFIHKKAIQFHDLSSFDLSKLYLTNLPMDATETDIKPLFPNCDLELHRNTDNTCIGTALLTFETNKEALKIFNQTNIKIKNVDVCINFSTDIKIRANKTDNKQENKSLLNYKVETDKMNEHIGIKRKHKKSSRGKQISQISERPEIMKPDSTTDKNNSKGKSNSEKDINKVKNNKKKISDEGESDCKKSKFHNENQSFSRNKVESDGINRDKKKKRKNKHDKDVTRPSDLPEITKRDIVKVKTSSNVKSISLGSLKQQSFEMKANEKNIEKKESNCKKSKLETENNSTTKHKVGIVNNAGVIKDKRKKKKKQKFSNGNNVIQTSERPEITKPGGIIDKTSPNVKNKTLGGMDNNINKSDIIKANSKNYKNEFSTVNKFKTAQTKVIKDKNGNAEHEKSLTSQQLISSSVKPSNKTSHDVKTKSPNAKNGNQSIKGKSSKVQNKACPQNESKIKSCEITPSSPKNVDSNESKIIDKDKTKRKKIKHKNSSFGQRNIQVSESPKLLRPDPKPMVKSSSNVKMGSLDRHDKGRMSGKENATGIRSKAFNKESKLIREKRQFDRVETDDTVLQPSKKPRIIKENSRSVVK